MEQPLENATTISEQLCHVFAKIEAKGFSLDVAYQRLADLLTGEENVGDDITE